MTRKRSKTLPIAVVGGIIVMLILVVGTFWMGQSTRKDSEQAVRTVSLLYLDELAGRREQVVASNLQARIGDMRTGLDLMTEEDLSDKEHLEAYQAKMKQIFNLERFAFVDTDGLIYTSHRLSDGRRPVYLRLPVVIRSCHFHFESGER